MNIRLSCLRSFDARKTRIKILVSIIFSPDRTKITLMVYMSAKTIKFKQQMEFESLKIIQDFKKVYMWRFLFCLVYMFINEISHS